MKKKFDRKEFIKNIINYEIDRKLKLEKHYPRELLGLIELFENPVPMPAIGKPISKKKLEEYYRLLSQEEIEKIPREKRKDYVLEVQKKFDTGLSKKALHQFKKEVSIIEKIFKDFFLTNSQEVVDHCVKKINAKLKYFHPKLQKESTGLSLAFEISMSNVSRSRNDLGLGHIYWRWLSETIIHLDPKLVHRCPYCQNTFFSKQRKRYHSECRSKYFSEKAVKNGLAKKRQKEYRERLKKKLKPR